MSRHPHHKNKFSRPSAGPNWWKHLFDQTYYDVYSKIIPQKRTQNQVKFILQILDLKKGKTIIDLGCGYGRHAILLAKKGYRVICVDYSQKLLDIASTEAKRENAHGISFLKQDMRMLRVENRCDAAISMFSSFGYFRTLREHQQTLLRVATALKPNGAILLDLANKYAVVRRIKKYQKQSANEGLIRHFLTHGGRRWQMIRDVEQKKLISSLRLFSLDEIKRLLAQSGFRIISIFGDFYKSPYKKTSPRMIVLARKREPRGGVPRGS